MQKGNGRVVFNRRIWGVGLVLSLSLTPGMQAAFVAPTLWSRGASGTTYQSWDVFSSPSGPNAPDVGLFNPNGTPNLVDTSGASIVTGSGNIYSSSSLLQIQVSIPDYSQAAGVTTVILQTRTAGGEINYSTARIGGAAWVDRGELLREPLGMYGSYAVESWYKFELPYSASSFTIEFQASKSSMSLDKVAVDTITAASFVPEPNPVPEPVTSLLLLLGMGSVAAARARS